MVARLAGIYPKCRNRCRTVKRSTAMNDSVLTSVSRILGMLSCIRTFASTSLPSSFSFGVDKSSSSPISTPASRSIDIAFGKSSINGGSKNLNGSIGYCSEMIAISLLYLQKRFLITSIRRNLYHRAKWKKTTQITKIHTMRKKG